MLEFEDVPPLRDPVLVAAFEGWNDAGEAASAAVEHLAAVWDAEAIAALDPEEYYDFQVNRPKVMRDDGQRRIVWPTTRILVARETGFGSRDVVLVEGIEPSTRWRSFTIELLEYAERLGVSTFVTLGALLADVPHTPPDTHYRDLRRRGRPAPARPRVEGVRGPDRHRRRHLRRRPPGWRAVGELLGRRSPLRRQLAVTQGDARVAGQASSRCST